MSYLHHFEEVRSKIGNLYELDLEVEWTVGQGIDFCCATIWSVDADTGEAIQIAELHRFHDFVCLFGEAEANRLVEHAGEQMMENS